MHVNRFDTSVLEYSTNLTTADRRHVQKAIKAAHRSQHKYRVGAALIVANRVATASNRLRNSSKNAPYTEQSVHAEVRAVLRAYKSGRGGTIYVARLGARNALLPSHPCKRCVPVLREAGVKRVVWWNGFTWVTSKL